MLPVVLIAFSFPSLVFSLMFPSFSFPFFATSFHFRRIRNFYWVICPVIIRYNHNSQHSYHGKYHQDAEDTGLSACVISLNDMNMKQPSGLIRRPEFSGLVTDNRTVSAEIVRGIIGYTVGPADVHNKASVSLGWLLILSQDYWTYGELEYEDPLSE
jgi:hypothetical protein